MHTTAFVTPVVEHWLEREMRNGSTPWRIDPATHHTMSERSYHGATSCSDKNGVNQLIKQESKWKMLTKTNLVSEQADNIGKIYFREKKEQIITGSLLIIL